MLSKSVTILRHPLASKRCVMVFRENGEDLPEMFELLTRYEAIGPIAKGTYGFVCSARDKELCEQFLLSPPDEYANGNLISEEREELFDNATLVAVKKLLQIFENNQPRMWLCATREIQLMMAFHHDNVMSASDCFIPLGEADSMTHESINRLKENFDSVYLVMKKMDYTLREVLDSFTFAPGDADGAEGAPLVDTITKTVLHPLSKDYRKFVLYQLLRGVGYLHLCQVMHRDLKPENVLVGRNYDACVTDFGQGRDFHGAAPGDEYQQTVVDNCTQWYASPETLTIAVGSATGFIDHESFHSADVWSIGCIAAEMLVGRPLFHTNRPGGVGQLNAIMSVLGPPNDEGIESLVQHRTKETHDLFLAVLQMEMQRYEGRQNVLRQILKSPFNDETPEEIDMIERFLCYDPRKRLTILGALESQYFVGEGYEPVIDPDDTARSVRSVRQEEMSDAVSGREFIWKLFLKRHPEVEELARALEVRYNAMSPSPLGSKSQNSPQVLRPSHFPEESNMPPPPPATDPRELGDMGDADTLAFIQDAPPLHSAGSS